MSTKKYDYSEVTYQDFDRLVHSRPGKGPSNADKLRGFVAWHHARYGVLASWPNDIMEPVQRLCGIKASLAGNYLRDWWLAVNPDGTAGKKDAEGRAAVLAAWRRAGVTVHVEDAAPAEAKAEAPVQQTIARLGDDFASRFQIVKR